MRAIFVFEIKFEFFFIVNGRINFDVNDEKKKLKEN